MERIGRVYSNEQRISNFNMNSHGRTEAEVEIGG